MRRTSKAIPPEAVASLTDVAFWTGQEQCCTPQDFRLALLPGPRGYSTNWNLSAIAVLLDDLLESGNCDVDDRDELEQAALGHVAYLQRLHRGDHVLEQAGTNQPEGLGSVDYSEWAVKIGPCSSEMPVAQDNTRIRIRKQRRTRVSNLHSHFTRS